MSCDICNGRGNCPVCSPEVEYENCPTCEGTGTQYFFHGENEVIEVYGTYYFLLPEHLRYSDTCETCKGEGRIIKS